MFEELEDGSGKRRRRSRRRRKSAPSGNSTMDTVTNAFARAEANVAANEHSRPNALYGLVQANPGTAIVAGATATATLTLNEESFVQWVGIIPLDSVAFMLNSFKVNGYDIVKAGPVNLSTFLDTINRIDRPTPLTGRKFNAAAKIEMTVTNISAAPAIFRGFSLNVIEPLCEKEIKGSAPAPGVVSYRRMRLLAGRLSPKRRNSMMG